MEPVLDRIASKRRERIEKEGPELSAGRSGVITGSRIVPVTPFLQDPALICEVKRSSPSRGAIAEETDPVEQTRIYFDYGVPTVSVLTEEDYFGGSLDDLVKVKESFPTLAVLRKDFLFDAADVEVSYRAGADAVLCIARMLSDRELEEIFTAAEELGIAVLAEAHSVEDINRLRLYEPRYVGINSRNLADFSLDMLVPPSTAASIDWQARLIFESGIFYPEHIRHARSAGFDGALVGEAVMRRPEIIPKLLKEFDRSPSVRPGEAEKPKAREGDFSTNYFWSRIAVKLNKAAVSPYRPLVKVCGLTRIEDAEAAAELGADILGFIFAPSEREATVEVVRSAAHITALKVAVLVARRRGGVKGGQDLPRAAGELDEQRIALVSRLLKEGYIDAVQLHGDETAGECGAIAFPYYKAVRPKSANAAKAAEDSSGKGREAYRCPRVLIDAFVPDRYGGTGKRVAPDIIEAARSNGPLWLAGGITPENAGEIIRSFRPELIDISSGVEKHPGEKDPQKLKALFKEIHSREIH